MWLKVVDAPYHNTTFLMSMFMTMVSIGGHAPAMFEAGPFKKQHSLHQKRVPKGMLLILFYVIILA
jgi:accessory gene regulator protein AgrB